MRNPAAQGQRDANHTHVVNAYRDACCSVVDLSHVGGGCADLLIGFQRITDLVEIKVENAEVRPGLQKDFHRNWRGSRIWVVRTAGDVEEHLKDLAMRARRVAW